MKERKGVCMRKYSKNKSKKTVAFLLLAAVLLLAGIGSRCKGEKPAWDVCYEMANRHIEWTYAGRK